MLVTHIVDILGWGRKYIPEILTDTLGELMHTQELRQILTYNSKGLPIVCLYSLHDGCNT
jgi:hypothetical protein